MLKETITFETWERDRTHRISLSLHEVKQILHALDCDSDYPNCDGQYSALANRMERMCNKIINKHQV